MAFPYSAGKALVKKYYSGNNLRFVPDKTDLNGNASYWYSRKFKITVGVSNRTYYRV